MKVDGAIFAIEPRTVGGCIDLAVVFFREHLLQIMQLVACFAIPSVALAWWLVDTERATLSGCSVLFMFQSPFLGAALVTSAGHRVFGEHFSPRIGLKTVWKRLFIFVLLVLVIKVITLISCFFFLFPAYIFSARYGFLPEIMFLENCPLKKIEPRLTSLMTGNFFSMVGRLVSVVGFFSVLSASLFMLVDLGSSTLFGYPILFRRVSGLEYAADELITFLTVDSRVAVVLLTILWLVYPLARLAWMFCYLDTRILKEGWDIELNFRIEAQRLEAVS